MARTGRSVATSGGWLGGPNSWRRVVLVGIVGGLLLALLAAVTSNVCSGGSGSLDDEEPTAIVPAPGVVPVDTEPPIDEFTPAPTVEVSTPEPTPTEALLEPTPTEAAIPTATEDVPLPTAEATPVATP